jgi:proteasome lid subunit RPN8/RPN11
MTNRVPKAAIAHAIECYPQESCGVIAGGLYRRCRNMAENPSEHFVICKEDYIAALEYGDIQAIIHSHPDESAKPSQADLSSCEETALPWAVISVINGEYSCAHWFEPSGYAAPFIGRNYVWGIHDCLSIVLDYYKRELSIDLGRFDRPCETWDKGSEEIYANKLAENGFQKVIDGPKTGDVILMQIGKSKVANHAAIYIENGILSTEPDHYPHPQCIVHHRAGECSRRDTYGGYWLEKTVSVWRHKNLKQSGFTAP